MATFPYKDIKVGDRVRAQEPGGWTMHGEVIDIEHNGIDYNRILIKLDSATPTYDRKWVSEKYCSVERAKE